MRPVTETIDRDTVLEKVFQRILQSIYRVNVGLTLANGKPFAEEDLSSLTAEEIVDRIKDFLNSDPIDEHFIIFFTTWQIIQFLCVNVKSHLS